MKVLLFGGDGQLGLEVRTRALDLNFEVVAPLWRDLDISNRKGVISFITEARPDVVINCAAYTAVDKAEDEKELAFKINGEGAGFIAEGSKCCGARLIHVSTDYVFGGDERRPILEDYPPSPVNVYGASKLAGELEVTRIHGEQSLIVRTSSLHGAKGGNFVHTMISLFKEKEKVAVVDDQIMSPTWAGWLSEVLLDLSRMDTVGIVHASGAGAISWYTFAQEILNLVKDELATCSVKKLEPVSAADFPRAARRPKYSVLDCSRLNRLLGRNAIHWRSGLVKHLREIGFHLNNHKE